MNPTPPEQTGSQVPWIMPWNSEGPSHESVRRSVELASMTGTDERGPLTLREDLRHRHSDGLRRRRAIVVLSMLGLASSALVTLYQVGLVRHLPDPLFRRVHADNVNAPCVSYQYGLPHAMLSLATHTANILFAGMGTDARASITPWIPIVAAGKAAADAGVAVTHLASDRHGSERSWCGYSLIDAVTRLGAAMLALPEALDALRRGLITQPFTRRVL
jgi:hypothetical protein